MSKVVVVLFAGLMLAGCSHEDREQTRQDAAKLGQDLKTDAKKANEVVSKEAKDARDRLKRDVDNAKK